MTRAIINYAARAAVRQYYYANDHSKDRVEIDAQPMTLVDARGSGCALDEEGFTLVPHISAVTDFADKAQVAALHGAEIVALLLQQTGADAVFCTSPGILRFSEKSNQAGALDNSMPARFSHIDITNGTALGFARGGPHEGRAFKRFAHYNVWRSFSGAPQDVPLAVCDARSVDQANDFLVADAIFDPPGGAPEWGFESWLVAHNSAHRWHWFPDMSRDEALIFKTSDSAHGNPVPHVAFDNPLAPADCHPRASIEMRAIAYWWA